VNNTGTAALTTSGLTLPTGFTLVEGLSASIAAGAFDTFTVQLDTSSTGTKSGQISFTTNDTDENPYNFSVTGTVNATSSAPVITPHNLSATNGQQIPLSSLFTVTGSGITQYHVWFSYPEG